MLSWFGGLVGYEELSFEVINLLTRVTFPAAKSVSIIWANFRFLVLQIILAKVFMPLSWVMGVPWEHCEEVGTLIGLKTVVNELIAYQKMGEFKKQGRIYGRSEAIATYAICGFANPGSIGIQIGVFTSLAPEKKEQVTSVIMRAFIAGSAVCFLTASIAGKIEI